MQYLIEYLIEFLVSVTASCYTPPPPFPPSSIVSYAYPGNVSSPLRARAEELYRDLCKCEDRSNKPPQGSAGMRRLSRSVDDDDDDLALIHLYFIYIYI